MPDSKPPRRAALCVNANARRGEEWYEQAKAALLAVEIELVSANLFKTAQAMDREIRRLLNEKCPLIVIGGGDGTMQSAAKRIAHSEAIMGVLPLGTGNSFARDLGIRTEIEHACDVIVNGDVTEVDLGVIQGSPFLNVATIGLSTIIARELDSDVKRFWGPFAYIRPILRAFKVIRPFRVRLTSEGLDESFECLQVVIGNGRFHAGPFPLSDDASITTGELIVYAIATKEKRALFRYIISMIRGKLEELSESKHFHLTEGRIETSPQKKVTIDGETKSRTPIDFSVAHKALKVMAPKVIPGDDQSESS